MSKAQEFANALNAMAFTDSEGDEIARIWVQDGTPYVAVIAIPKLSLEDARKLGAWLVGMTEEGKE